MVRTRLFVVASPAGRKEPPPHGGEVAERQRWPVGLCPFPAARSLTGKLRAGHAWPLPYGKNLPRNCREVRRDDMESAPTEGIGRKGNNNEVPRASNARPYIVLQIIKTKTPLTLNRQAVSFYQVI